MRLLRFRYAVGIALFALAGCASVEPASTSAEAEIERAAAAAQSQAATSTRLEADVRWLADDAREGRETGTQGYDQAAAYVAARLAGLGVEPGADGSWYQTVPFVSGVQNLDASSMSITGPDGEKEKLSHLDDFRVFPSIALESFSIEDAPAVFVGYGVHAPAFGHDDYAGVDVEGKVVVYFSGAPDIFDNESRAHFNSNALKAKEASDRGAIGIVSLYTGATEESRPWERFVANPRYSQMTWVWPDGTPETSGRGIKGSATPHPEKAALLFEGAQHTYSAARAAADGEGEPTGSFDLAVTVSMAGAMEVETVTSPNVVGLIRGTDPQLQDEYVVLTGHLDHIGVNERLEREGKDGINNGAMDNATGIATMLEVARRFQQEGAPKRSILIVALTAEEKGLLGADYFAHFPPVGGGSMVANVNLDMPVMLHEFTDVVAFGAERSSIGPIMNAALEETGIALSPDPIPQLGIFTRSDHYRFVEKGVPSIFLWPGFADGGEEKFWDFYRNHYHRPSDDFSQPILYDSLVRFTDVNYVIARALATTPERPSWNDGDFFGDLFTK